MDLFMKPLTSNPKSREYCVATDAGPRYNKCVNYFHPVI